MSESNWPASQLEALPILPLRNSVLFPAAVVPVNVGRARSVRLIEEAFGGERPTIGVLTQRDPDTEDPVFEDLYRVGTLARVLKVIRLSSGHYSVVLQGIGRIRVEEPLEREPCLRARVSRLSESHQRSEDIDALFVQVRETARGLIELLPHPPRELETILENVRDPGALADLVASHMPLANDQKQRVLDALELRDRLRAVLELLHRQVELHRVKREISHMVQEEMSRSQRELLLRQQMRSIRRELGEPEDEDDELELLRERLAKAELPAEAKRAAKRELSRMSGMSPSSAEYQVAFNYVEWFADLPWNRLSADRFDVGEVRRVLDEDHHGLEEPKKRIVEYVAVRKLRGDKKGPILCFIGPPGVGKTSLARSIARATGRELARIALGGVHDEAEIRGHRRTYVGAMPGRIIAGLKKARMRNPVFVLDEVDKLASDISGDPASALLEVLDPEQNDSFVDHYLDVPMDLSQILFVATANRRDTIPGPLLDRMEVIDIPGYTRDERIGIAKQFLVPRQLSEHGLTPEHLDLTDAAIGRLVDEYAREAGVRKLEQRVASLCRDVAVRFAGGEDVRVVGDERFVEKVLGPPRHDLQMAEKLSAPGIATGLAWTPAGGDLLFVETTGMPGKGEVHLTGQMGSIMKESAAAAFTYIRSRSGAFGLEGDFLSKIDVHVHLPKGGIPKDGPSQGIAIFVALASMLTRARVRPDVAMTGEVTLRGKVLRVEGLKQKCLAAHRAGLKHVILPRRNEADVAEIPEQVRSELSLHFVSNVEEVLPLVLEDPKAAPAIPIAQN